MKRIELIKKYIDFFKSKNHAEINNSSLIPENDPTVLFITAGMQPLVPFLLGQPHPQGKRLVGNQRCIRTGDIESIGNSTHHTMFEMLGNWSLGDYFKNESIQFSFEFLTKHLNIPKEKLAVTVFKGDQDAPKDSESKEKWLSLGIPEERIAFLDKKDNWWGPAGATGPCGPDTEIFYWKQKDKEPPKKFNPEDKNWVEIWNNVLMGYQKTKDGKIIPAEQKNIDTGMGVERMITILSDLEDNYLSDAWLQIIKEIEKETGKKYSENKKEMRIIADHIKASSFMINDKVIPSNSEQGYVLRRLIRRYIRTLKKMQVDLDKFKIENMIQAITSIYPDYNLNKDLIINELKKEEEKFKKTLEKGLKEFEKLTKTKTLNAKDSFLLYQSYGFPLELIQELSKEKSVSFNPEHFKSELKKHQLLSKTTSAGKFKSGLADNSEQTTKLHTAAHLLLAALKKVLGESVNQRGSNITPERLRFDFSFNRKLTDEEKEKIENLINDQIKNNLTVTREEMPLKEAKEKGASGIFDSKYSEIVSVYTIGDFSKEICTGPHVKNTNKLGKFKIIKEQSSSSGVRRIKAILE